LLQIAIPSQDGTRAADAKNLSGLRATKAVSASAIWSLMSGIPKASMNIRKMDFALYLEPVRAGLVACWHTGVLRIVLGSSELGSDLSHFLE
jgi:hypothetical protein